MQYIHKVKFEEERLDEALSKYNFNIIIKILYSTHEQTKAYNWAKKYCEKGYIPLWYFLIRHYAINKFDNREDTVLDAFTMALKSIVMSYLHISRCKEINKSFEISKILCSRFDDKFKGYLTCDIFSNAIINTKEYYDNIKFEKIPDSKWIRTCKRGGWFEPGLSFTLYMEDNINFEYNKERCDDAYNQIINRIENVYHYYKDTNDLELSRFIL